MASSCRRAHPAAGVAAAAALTLAAVAVFGQGAPPQSPPSPLPAGQQPPPPVIRSGAEIVRVDVSVIDSKGQPVPTLTADDFEIREDGVPQTIQSFKFVSVNGRPDEGDETSLPIRSREHAAAEAARDDVRVFLIFWDEYHINRMASALQGREYLMRFVKEAFGPTDLVAIMDPLTPADAIRFSRDRYALAETVRRLRGRLGEYIPPRSVIEEAHLRSREGVERLRSQVTLTALKSAAVELGSLRQGRKSIILISEGMRGLRRDEEMSMMTDLINAANDTNTGIYTVNPLGLTVGRVRTFEMLQALATNTGGEWFATNDLGRAMQRVVTQSSAYYLLGYAPAQRAFDGKFHKIRVRVKRSGLDVRARAGYWAPTIGDMKRAEQERASTLPAPIASALSELTPDTARRAVDLWIGTRVGPAGQPQVTLAWSPRGDDQSNDAEVASATAVARGAGGLAFEGEIDRRGQTFDVPPGQLQITFAARDEAGDVLDRHERIIQVPDPAGGGLWISSPVVIRTRTPGELRTARTDPATPPAAEREFSRSDRLLIRFAVHGANATAADVTARLLNHRAAPLTPLSVARTGTTYEIDLPLISIVRGDFVIRIEARHDNERAETFVPLRIAR
jgi:VWFA-related protein